MNKPIRYCINCVYCYSSYSNNYYCTFGHKASLVDKTFNEATLDTCSNQRSNSHHHDLCGEEGRNFYPKPRNGWYTNDLLKYYGLM